MPEPLPTPRRRPSRLPGVVALGLLLGAAGCGGGTTPPPPQFSPDDVAAKAIQQYDKNGDGVFDAAELEHCPGLKAVVKTPDGKLTADQLKARLHKMAESNVGRLSLTCKIYLDGAPLEGATVRLVPEKFMGESVQVAVGTTGKDGVAVLKSEDGAKEGVQLGYYRVEVTGAKALPSRYNAQTTLGCEVAHDQHGSLVLRLTS